MPSLNEIFESPDDSEVFQEIRDRVHAKDWHLDPSNLFCPTLTEGELFVILARMFVEEVANGGFDQFICNSSGDYAELVAEMFRRLEATEAVEALDSIRKEIYDGKPIPTKPTERGEVLFAWEDRDKDHADHFFERHDYALDWVVYVETIMARYIRGHKEMFS